VLRPHLTAFHLPELPCDWIIVTSIRQTRLHYKGADQHTYKRFDMEKLASDDALLKKFVFLPTSPARD
jgi:hypothetical protein